MKVKFVEYKNGETENCLKCHYWESGCKNKLWPNSDCCQYNREDKKNGYFVEDKRNPRAVKYERLLKALLKQCEFNAVCRTINKEGWFCLSTKQNDELIKIKEGMK